MLFLHRSSYWELIRLDLALLHSSHISPFVALLTVPLLFLDSFVSFSTVRISLIHSYLSHVPFVPESHLNHCLASNDGIFSH